MTFEEFIARAKSAPERDIGKELRQLYVDGGTLQVLVKDILDMRQDMLEALTGMQMISQDMIYRGIGQQGQVMAVDQLLHRIHEAMVRKDDEHTDEQAASQRGNFTVP